MTVMSIMRRHSSTWADFSSCIATSSHPYSTPAISNNSHTILIPQNPISILIMRQDITLMYSVCKTCTSPSIPLGLGTLDLLDFLVAVEGGAFPPAPGLPASLVLLVDASRDLPRSLVKCFAFSKPWKVIQALLGHGDHCMKAATRSGTARAARRVYMAFQKIMMLSLGDHFERFVEIVQIRYLEWNTPLWLSHV